MKNSIKALITITIISLQAISSKAQNAKVSTGIYLTEQDYESNKLTYQLRENDKLQLNEFLNGEHINLVYQGKKIKLTKDKIFGYRLNKQDFRIYHNEAYHIMDTAGFVLYKRQQLTQQGKGYLPVETYFYSLSPKQPVLRLTIENLWNSFPEQTGFRYSVQNNFKQDVDLAVYDHSAGQYKIKYLYFQQKQTAAHASL